MCLIDRQAPCSQGAWLDPVLVTQSIRFLGCCHCDRKGEAETGLGQDQMSWMRHKQEVCEIKEERPVGGVVELRNQSPRQSQGQNLVVCALLILCLFPPRQGPQVLCGGGEESPGYDVQ